MRRIRLLALVGVGGAAGALVRWRIAEAWTGDGFPWATFIVNVIGCALLGLLATREVSTESSRLIGAGFCGGLTTFSTLSVEIVELLDSGRPALAAIYVLASVVIGLGAYVATRSLNPEAHQ